MINQQDITLRSFVTSDKIQLVEVLNRHIVVRYLSSKIPSPYTEQDATWWINEGSRQGFVRAICYRGKFVGCIGVNPGEFEYQRSGEIGYWLDSAYWGKGIMSQAIKLITAEVFGTTSIVRIFAAVFEPNLPSKKVLLKSGFHQEAVLKDAIFKDNTFFDNHIFVKLKPRITD